MLLFGCLIDLCCGFFQGFQGRRYFLTVEIASFCGIKIYAQLSNRVTFFNSPYPAHFEHKAVGIYPSSHDAPLSRRGKGYVYL